MNEDTTKLTAIYDQDTKRYHRYLLDPDQQVAGTLYITKEIAQVPKELIIELRVRDLGVSGQAAKD